MRTKIKDAKHMLKVAKSIKDERMIEWDSYDNSIIVFSDLVFIKLTPNRWPVFYTDDDYRSIKIDKTILLASSEHGWVVTSNNGSKSIKNFDTKKEADMYIEELKARKKVRRKKQELKKEDKTFNLFT